MTKFFIEDSGAVTVDWVVLTAGLVGLGLATMSVVSSGVEDTSTDVRDALTTTVIQDVFDTVTTVALPGTFGPEWIVTGQHHDDPYINNGSGMFLLMDNPSFSSTFDVDPNAEYVVVEMDITALGKWEGPGETPGAGVNDVLNISANGTDLGDLYLENENSGHSGDPAAISITHHDTTFASASENAARLAVYGDPATDSNSSNLNRTHSYTVRVVVENNGADTFDFDMAGSGLHGNGVPGEGVSFDAIRVVSTDSP